MTGPAALAGGIPAGPPCPCSTHHMGIDEFGQPVHIRIIYRNLLAAGEPGGGKSGLLNTFAAHTVLSVRSRLVLFDGKQVELGMWDHIADEFVGPDLDHAIITLLPPAARDGQPVRLAARPPPPQDRTRRRPVRHHHHVRRDRPVRHRAGHRDRSNASSSSLLRDLVARGRAAAMPVLAATQRPSVDIIPKSLRDLFGYRAAFRCTSTGSSDIILGDGWSDAGFSATDIAPTNPGEALPDRRRRHPPADQGRLPLRRRHHRPGRLRRLDPPHPRPRPPPQARPPPSPDPPTRKGNRHDLLHHRPRRQGTHSSAPCASWPTTSTSTRPSRSRLRHQHRAARRLRR